MLCYQSLSSILTVIKKAHIAQLEFRVEGLMVPGPKVSRKVGMVLGHWHKKGSRGRYYIQQVGGIFF